MESDRLKVGELAKRAGTSVRTLHYYDEIGLLSPSHHTASGHRLYDANDVARLQQIHSPACRCARGAYWSRSRRGQRQSLISNGFHNLPQSGHVDALGIVDAEREPSFMANDLSSPVPVYLGQLKRPNETFAERMEGDALPLDSLITPICWEPLGKRMSALTIWAAGRDARAKPEGTTTISRPDQRSSVRLSQYGSLRSIRNSI